MKANVKLGIVCALALLGLSSCRTEEMMEKNPTYDAQENTVKANFVVNVSTGSGGANTKTSAEFAQVGSSFLGMDAAHILTYSLKNGEKPNFLFTPSYRENSEVVKVASTRDFNLGTLLPAKSITETQSTRSVELMLPLETDCVLLYAKALKTHSSDLQGAVALKGDPEDLETLHFSLVPRLDSIVRYNAGGLVFARIMNYIITAGLVNEVNTDGKGFWTTTTGDTDRSYGFWWPLEGAPANPPTGDNKKDGYSEGGYTWHQGQLAWKQLGKMYEFQYDSYATTYPEQVMDGYPLTPLGEVLGQAYQSIVTIQVDATDPSKVELRAGAATSILRTVEDLYAIIDRVGNAVATSWAEEVARQLALEIKRRCIEFFHYNNKGFFFGPYKENTSGEDISNNGKLTSSEIQTMLSKLALFGMPSEWNNKEMNRLINAEYFYYTTTTTSGTETKTTVNEGFPNNIGLPKGGAVMRTHIYDIVKDGKNTPDSFYYDPNIPAYGMGSVTFPVANYRYPPEIMYYGNSEIRTTNASIQNWPSDASAWDFPGSWATWDSSGAASSVTSYTRSVAMMRHINYGTALLKSRVMTASGVTVLYDNNHNLHPNEDANEILPSGDGVNKGLVITGIVIGGQPNTVCWDFTRASSEVNTVWKWVPKDANNPNAAGHYVNDDGSETGSPVSFTGNGFEYMIYDRVSDYTDANNVTKSITVMPYKTDGASDDNVIPIYTMCWDNYDASKNEQNNVFFAVEMRNESGADFWGELNIVRKGGTFYLVGELDLNKVASQKDALITSIQNQLSANNYHYPPFNPATGATIEIPRIFMQDYMTIANILLKEDALQHAYVTMPDLRSSQISLGLSVNTVWQQGYTFDVNIGNGLTN